MKKILKMMLSVCLILVSLCFVACGKDKDETVEKISLAKTMLGEVEFENADKVELSQEDDKWVVSGEIEAMSLAQKSAFGVDDVTHIVVVKFEFDKERTIDYFKIEGSTTKVYSTDETDENYVGAISELLDNESGEDAFCYLILSANTKEYKLTSRYTDGVESEVEIEIEASLVTATTEE